MRFFLMTGLVIIWEFDAQWHPGHKNLADYYTKHFERKHHMELCSWYLHKYNPPRLLPRAEVPISLRWCVGILPNGYIRLATLLWIPLGTPISIWNIIWAYDTGNMTSIVQITESYDQKQIFYVNICTHIQDYSTFKATLTILVPP